MGKFDAASNSNTEAEPLEKLLKDKGRKQPNAKAKDRDHRTNQATTYTTPIVSEISRNLFSVPMDVATPSSDSSKTRRKKRAEAKAHKTAIEDVVFSDQIPSDEIPLHSDGDNKAYYGKATIEGVEYKVSLPADCQNYSCVHIVADWRCGHGPPRP